MAQGAVGVGPFVPDPHAALLQPAGVGVAAQEPEQLVDDALQVHLLGGEQRETLLEVEAHLIAERRESAGAGAVVLSDAVGKYMAQEVLVLLHVFDEFLTRLTSGVAGRFLFLWYLIAPVGQSATQSKHITQREAST